MMLRARVAIVSERPEVAGELRALLSGGGHVATVVPGGSDLLELMDAGLVPDLVISDLGSPGAYERLGYVGRFRELNRAGCHLVVTGREEGTPGLGGALAERFPALRHPFDAGEVGWELERALERIEERLHSTRAEVWRSLDRLRREVEGVRGEMVRVLARTIAARDEYMTGHLERVAELAERMAAAMGMDDARRARIRGAAQLHEIGKIALPVQLLQKTEPLTPEELERIRGHARTGAEILRDVPSLAGYAPLVEHVGVRHDGLDAHLRPGSEDARLVGVLRVADVFDATTSARSYRPAMPRTYWEPLLRRGAGTLFDPAAVDALFRVLDGGAQPPSSPSSRIFA